MELHPRNKHKGTYDFIELTFRLPELKQYVRPNKYGNDSIDFSDANAVKTLNKALLKSYYKIDFWDIPDGFLVPPIPGRGDYIHNIADLLKERTGEEVKILDIGTGSSLIYPIIGSREYGWSFIATEIDEESMTSAQQIIDKNKKLKNIEIRHQKNPRDIFLGALKSNEFVDITICNPPFHASIEEARKGTLRKLRNLNKGKTFRKAELNFGGKGNELWTEGGEKQFIFNMIRQSIRFAENVGWFTVLVSKESIVPAIISSLKANGAKSKIIEMGQGNKKSRIICWRFNKKVN
ncbi:MAG: 23S rRNA (adenine1618-N6)-methyltransferase [Flavobacteriales bacterium]|jgi:23S rRNA (adenine1618-N6)-methyltransferase|tara:strand:+ start:418 stop:1296 length:879 start_codon:yes stop_codon:yes gene_type:complete